MIYLVTGASHTGKTAFSQRLLEQYRAPYLSLDHLKMGLIRSGMTALTPMDADEDLTALLWPIAREIIKTAVENGQDLIVEGIYIPFDWKKDFTAEYLDHIRYYCLILSEAYIKTNFHRIQAFANVIEHRLEDSFTLEEALRDNAHFLAMAKKHGLPYFLIEDSYEIPI